MKNKKFKSFICFLLCFVLLFSLPLNTTAHALAVESYLIYAIITGLAAMGFTFTVAGGVDAMIQAMEEKVDDYQKQGEIIDFYEIMRRNLKMVPSPSGGTDPDGNQLRNLFFNALAWDALEKFVDWLTSDGGWSLGNNYNDGYQFATLDAQQQVNGVYGDTFTVSTSLIGDWESSTYFGQTSKRAPIKLIGTARVVKSNNDVIKTTDLTGNFSTIYYRNNSYFTSNVLSTGTTQSTTEKSLVYVVGAFYENMTISEFVQNNEIAFVLDDGEIGYGLVRDDGFLYFMNYLRNYEAIESTLSYELEIPLELPQIKPLPEQGVIMQQLEIGSPEIQEWARQVEELFIETGTIPQPQPEVITDPDYVPQPTPAPTPVPSPEIEDIEDLGLPALGEAIFNKFPFSLPKDIARVFDILTAEPLTPYWELDLTNDAIGISSKFVIDLEPYETVGQICRWVSVISFSLFLIIITKGMIGW